MLSGGSREHYLQSEFGFEKTGLIKEKAYR
jgi:hypothetical protein